MFAAASATDDGLGSLRFFWSSAALANGWVNDPSHVAVLGPRNFLGARSRIDNNGAPANINGFNAPTWRSLSEGVGDGQAYVNGPAGYEPQSKTLPAFRGGTNQYGLIKSLLEELDEE